MQEQNLPDQPKYSKKLKRLIGRIKRRIQRNKVAGIVILYEPGFSEYLCVIDTPFSRVRFTSTPGKIEIQDKIEDFKGDEVARKEAMEQTMNMLLHLGSMSRLMFQNFNNMASQVEKKATVVVSEEAKPEQPEAEPGKVVLMDPNHQQPDEQP